jgi:hypothetical protein
MNRFDLEQLHLQIIPANGVPTATWTVPIGCRAKVIYASLVHNDIAAPRNGYYYLTRDGVDLIFDEQIAFNNGTVYPFYNYCGKIPESLMLIEGDIFGCCLPAIGATKHITLDLLLEQLSGLIS